MTVSKSIALASMLALASCSLEESKPQLDSAHSSADDTHYHATVKPGANVNFTTSLQEPLSPGDVGTLQITVTEGYKSGTMRLTATAGEGLELVTTIDETIFDVSNTDTHTWEVFFDTESAGKFYINLHARIETPIGPIARSYSAPIIVGTPAPKTQNTSSLSTTTGERVVTMEAVETIRQ